MSILAQERTDDVSQRLHRPTPDQARALAEGLWRCRTRSHTAREPRRTAWRRGHRAVSRSEQDAELQDRRAERPEEAALHAPVLPDVLARRDMA
jgi:hypothetical protein